MDVRIFHRLIEEVVKSPVLNPDNFEKFYKIRHTIKLKSEGILQISNKQALKAFNNADQKKFSHTLKGQKYFIVY